MRAVDQWAAIEADFPAGWTDATLAFTPEGPVAEAAAVLVPLRPGRVGDQLRVDLERELGDATRLRGLLGRLDKKRIWGTLSLVDVTAPEAAAGSFEAARDRTGLAEAWDDAVATLPPDWSDVLFQLDLDSSDHIPRASLLGAPLNPTRVPGAIAIRFRAASGKNSYGTSPVMVRRCLERMDAEGITGGLSVVFGLSDADNAVTQGPVWRVAGRSV